MKKEYRNVARTKKAIRLAFVELLEENNVDGLTVAKLAERADIAKSSFYNHYEDIYAVVEEFENELIEKLSIVLEEIEANQATEYEDYIKKVLEFLKEHEDVYRKAIKYRNDKYDVRYFIEKLKSVLSKKIFEESVVLPFSKKESERYVQIRILTNACVDTMVDYFNGKLDLSLDEVGAVILEFLNKLK